MVRLVLLTLACLGLANAETPMLTDEDFDTTVYDSGKSVFVKFFAPWCGHCKKMKPDWDALATEFNTENSNVIIADVDCTTEKDLCQKHGVRGYPTVKYMQMDEGTAYNGKRDLESLKEFVKTELSKPICNSANKAACDPEDLVELEKYEKMAPEERKAETERIQEEVKTLEKGHETLLESLQKQYETSKEETEKKVAEISKPLKYLKKIKDDGPSAPKDEV